MALSVTHSKTLLAPSTGSADKVYGSDYVSLTSHTLSGIASTAQGGTGTNSSAATGVAHVAAGAWTYSAVVESDITLADNTTNNASTSAHGFLLKLNNSATQFMNGQGAWSTPASSLTIGQAVTGGNANSLLIEDASGNLAAPSGLTWATATGEGLTIAAGTPTSGAPKNALNISQTWNAAGDSFTAAKINVTNTNSAAASYLQDWQLGGTSIIRITKSATPRIEFFNSSSAALNYNGTSFNFTAALILDSNLSFQGSNPTLGMGNAVDVNLSRISAGLFGIGTGAAGSFAGNVKLTTLNVNTSVLPVTNGVPTLGAASNGFGALYLDFTNTGTVGSVTINKPSGRVNLGAGGTTLTLTNSLITAASKVIAIADGAPGNLVAVQIYTVPAAGSCTINAVPAVTNQTAIDFIVINAD